MLVLAGVSIVLPSLAAPRSGLSTARPDDQVGTVVGARAPDIRVAAIDGKQLTLSSLRGRPALIWFTTTYCVPCQQGAVALRRILERLHATNQVAVAVLFVDPGETTAALADWKTQFGGPNWLVALAPSEVVRAYRIQALDTKFLLDDTGMIRATDFLPLDEAAWERHIASVLGS